MIKNKFGLKGSVSWTVFDKDGNIKRYAQKWYQRLLGIPGDLMQGVNHNIVTDEGDAMIADLMAETPARTKVNNANGYMQVGTGWTGTTPKANTVLNTATGSTEAMDATYPKVKGAFGAANDNVVQYKSSWEAGDLNATGIDEVALFNHATPASGDLLAYAQITPAIDVTTADTLAITWEITALGA